MSIQPVPVPVVSKPWYQSKTLLVGALEVLIGVAGLLAPFFSTGVYTAQAVTVLVAGVLTIIMRLLTETAIS